jgi:hypothetical protein
MRRTIPLVRSACVLALLTLLAGAIGVPADTAREVPLAGTTNEAWSSFAPAEAAADAHHRRAHQHRVHRSRHKSRDRQEGAVKHDQAASRGNSAATITGSFADSCRDFSAHSSKDISHVEIHYIDGRVVKDESTTTPDYAIHGGDGDEIEFAFVKSGTTREHFDCVRANGPPTAILEIKGPCGTLTDGTLSCDIDQEDRNAWTWSRPGNGLVFWGCNDNLLCVDKPTDPAFRGTASTDPDGDIVSWLIDFGDGTSTGGNWTTEPPTEVVHLYPPFPGAVNNSPMVTLTVTDSAGQTDSDTLRLQFITPD